MSDEEDYLSDKFLASLTASAPEKKNTSYTERRRQAIRESELRNAAGRKKSVRQMEEESRREGLSRSLFDRAQDDEESEGIGKAMKMMAKMGYKPGQALGKRDEATTQPPTETNSEADDGIRVRAVPLEESTASSSGARVNPISIGFWQGRKGVGLGKRALSPSAEDRASKAAKLEVDETTAQDRDTFRSKSKASYEERRDFGRLAAARKTCANLDERQGIEFNVYWLDPNNIASFPAELLEKLNQTEMATSLENVADELPDDEVDYARTNTRHPDAKRLRKQMQRDSLAPLSALDEEEDDTLGKKASAVTHFDDEATVLKAVAYLQLSARDKLSEVLAYLRVRHSYCFWCGSEYANADELQKLCPGPEEELHD